MSLANEGQFCGLGTVPGPRSAHVQGGLTQEAQDCISTHCPLLGINGGLEKKSLKTSQCLMCLNGSTWYTEGKRGKKSLRKEDHVTLVSKTIQAKWDLTCTLNFRESM